MSQALLGGTAMITDDHLQKEGLPCLVATVETCCSTRSKLAGPTSENYDLKAEMWVEAGERVSVCNSRSVRALIPYFTLKTYFTESASFQI